MRKITKENTHEVIDEEVSEFKKDKNHDMWYGENDYLHVGNFGHFLRDRIKEQGIDDTVKNSFSMLNGIFNSGEVDEYIKTMFHIEIFEVLGGSDETIKAAKELLTGEALESFKKVINFNPYKIASK